MFGNDIGSFLRKLLDSADTKKLNVSYIKRILAAAWNAKELDFIRSGEIIHGRTLVENVLREPFTVRAIIEDTYVPLEEGGGAEIEAGMVAGDSAVPGETSATSSDSAASPELQQENGLRTRCIRQLAQRRGFIWAGFVVNDVLPSLGASKREAQDVFDELVRDGVVQLSKVANPNNPDFPVTAVQLNREHPEVRRVAARNGRPAGFRPVAVRGEPASVTLIRERR